MPKNGKIVPVSFYFLLGGRLSLEAIIASPRFSVAPGRFLPLFREAVNEQGEKALVEPVTVIRQQRGDIDGIVVVH
jgi:hypothetical protein